MDKMINSCRVCQSENYDNDFLSLLNEDGSGLSPAGHLYEELVGLQIQSAPVEFYPTYLCNSCDLQMKLFKKLKTRAYRTIELVHKKYNLLLTKLGTCSEIKLEETAKLNQEIICHESQKDHENIHETSIADYCEGVNYESSETAASNKESVTYEVLSAEGEQEIIESFINTKNESQMNSDPPEFKSEEYLEEFTENSEDVQYIDDRSEFDLEYDLDENDMLEEIVGEHNESTNTENKNYFDQNLEVNDNDEDDCHSVYFLEDETNEFENVNEENSPFKCDICAIIFGTRAEYNKHRKYTHDNKYICKVCNKKFSKMYSLQVHMRIHEKGFPFKCELCEKTFNQKVHYQYHMNKHNNIRPFECEHCGKCFIAKGDLSIHLRIHNNDRPYICEICDKNFLQLEHLKMHRYSHQSKQFECDVCKQKFISPSTLRMHVRTIHWQTELPFECLLCKKKFRRKHHLELHYKVHQKPEKLKYSKVAAEQSNNTREDESNDVNIENEDDWIIEDDTESVGCITTSDQ